MNIDSCSHQARRAGELSLCMKIHAKPDATQTCGVEFMCKMSKRRTGLIAGEWVGGGGVIMCMIESPQSQLHTHP